MGNEDDSIAVSLPMRAAGFVYLVSLSLSWLLLIWLVLAIVVHVIWPEIRLPPFPTLLFIGSWIVVTAAKVTLWWLFRSAFRRRGD